MPAASIDARGTSWVLAIEEDCTMAPNEAGEAADIIALLEAFRVDALHLRALAAVSVAH